jgi:maleylacetoacetate isomerase
VKLYSYFRSSAAYRVRIALNLKGIAYETVPVHLVRDGGEQKKPAFKAINPQMRVPALELDDGAILTQSPAILDYLEEVYPSPPLLPGDPVVRAKVRAVADIVGCDIHPLNNLPVLGYIKTEFGQDQAAVDSWYAHWISVGFKAIEQLIDPGPFAFGGTPGLADVFLVPQVFNARRFKVSLKAFPGICAAEQACLALPAFANAAPDNQPDAE